MASADGPIKRPPRNRNGTLFEFDMQRDANQAVRQYFVGDPYPPCTKSIDELESVKLSDLDLNENHRGKVLFVRTVDDGIRAAAIQTIVEDDTGAVERLAVYNYHALEEAADLIRDEAAFAIKEPFLEVNAGGSLCLRVDHPSDLVWLPPSDPRIPAAFRDKAASSTLAADWKLKGNEFYKAGKYTDAVQAFTSGLHSSGDDDGRVKCDISRNRAVTNLLLKRFDEAMVDAKAAVIATEREADADIAPLDSKSHFRAGRAAYELREFEQAKNQFTTALQLSPQDQDCARELKRTEERLKEASTGVYDVAKMSEQVSKRRNRLDHADFLSNVVKREAGAHGNGLFASRNIAAGELILCEKAFAIAFDSDQASQDFTLLDSKSQRQIAGTQAYLLFNVVAKLLHNHSKSNDLFDLYDGGYSRRTPMQVTDGLQVIDAFRAQAVLTYNTYGCPTVKTTSKAAQRQVKSTTGYPSTGFWSTVSYINHACNGNAMRSFIGDLMMVRATRDIVKDEEILMPYRLPVAENEVAQAELERIWGFRCDCSLCKAEAEVTAEQRKERAQHLKQSSDLLSGDAKSANKKATLAIEKLLKSLEATYSNELFDNKPRLGAVEPGKRLCQIHSSQKAWKKTAEFAIGLLRNLGFVVTISEEKQTVSVTRSHCLLVDDAIVAAIYAGWAYENLKKTNIQDQMLTLARELYETLNGEMNGFDEKIEMVKKG